MELTRFLEFKPKFDQILQQLTGQPYVLGVAGSSSEFIHQRAGNLGDTELIESIADCRNTGVHEKGIEEQTLLNPTTSGTSLQCGQSSSARLTTIRVQRLGSSSAEIEQDDDAATLWSVMMKLRNYREKDLFKDHSQQQLSDVELKQMFERKKAKVMELLKSTSKDVKDKWKMWYTRELDTAKFINKQRNQTAKLLNKMFKDRFGNLGGKLEPSWTETYLSGDDIQQMMSDDPLELTLIKGYGSEWEDYYRKLKESKAEELYKSVVYLREYKLKMTTFMDNKLCIDRDDLDAAEVATIRDLEAPPEDMMEKLNGFVQEIREPLIIKVESNRVAEMACFQKAIEYAFEKYRELLKEKTMQLLEQDELAGNSKCNSAMDRMAAFHGWDEMQREVYKIISVGFESVPDFQYTRFWKWPVEEPVTLKQYNTEERDKYIMCRFSGQQEDQQQLSSSTSHEVNRSRREANRRRHQSSESETNRRRHHSSGSETNGSRQQSSESETNRRRHQRSNSETNRRRHHSSGSESSSGLQSKRSRADFNSSRSNQLHASPTPRSQLSSPGLDPCPTLMRSTVYFVGLHYGSGSTIVQIFSPRGDPKELFEFQDFLGIDQNSKLEPVVSFNSAEGHHALLKFVPSKLIMNHDQISTAEWETSSRRVYFNLDGVSTKTPLTAEEILALHLQQVLNRIEQFGLDPLKAEKVVVAVPAMSNPACRRRLKSALDLVGWTNSVLVHTSTAVALSCTSYRANLPLKYHMMTIHLQNGLAEVAVFEVSKRSEYTMLGVESSRKLHCQRVVKEGSAVFETVTLAEKLLSSLAISNTAVRLCALVVETPPNIKPYGLIQGLEKELKKAGIHCELAQCPPRKGILPGLGLVAEARQSGNVLYRETFPWNIDLRYGDGDDRERERFVKSGQRANMNIFEAPAAGKSPFHIVVQSLDRHGIGRTYNCLQLNNRQPQEWEELAVQVDDEGLIIAVIRTADGEVIQDCFGGPFMSQNQLEIARERIKRIGSYRAQSPSPTRPFSSPDRSSRSSLSD